MVQLLFLVLFDLKVNEHSVIKVSRNSLFYGPYLTFSIQQTSQTEIDITFAPDIGRKLTFDIIYHFRESIDISVATIKGTPQN